MLGTSNYAKKPLCCVKWAFPKIVVPPNHPDIKIKWHKAAERHKHEGPFWECCSLPWSPSSWSFMIFPKELTSSKKRLSSNFWVRASSSMVTPCKNSKEECTSWNKFGRGSTLNEWTLHETAPITVWCSKRETGNLQWKLLLCNLQRDKKQTSLKNYRRKFRSLTSDNMDSWKSSAARKKINRCGKKEDQQARNVREVAKCCVFQCFVCRLGRKVTSLKRRVRR